MTGRHVVLTGASSGVGRHLTKSRAREGGQISCCARRRAELESLVAEIEATGGKANAQVGDANSIVRAFDGAEAAAGLVDTVICNAGINVAGPAHSITVEDIDRIMSITCGEHS